MLTLRRLSKVSTVLRRRAHPASAALVLLAICSLTSPAFASSMGLCDWDCGRHWRLPGISLAELVEGREFESLDGQLVFTGFEAEVEGVAIRDLDLYRVLPTVDGFKLLSPLFVVFGGAEAELTLGYQVATAGEGLFVESASIAFLGFALGEAEAWVEAQLSSLDGDPAGTLSVRRSGPFNRGRSRDHQDLDPLLSEIAVSELIGVNSGWKHCFGGLAKVLAVDHSFQVTVVPEPTTGLLVALGLIGMATRRRRSR